MPIVTRQASSDAATWRPDKDRQAPRPATVVTSNTGHGSATRHRREPRRPTASP